MVYDDFCKDVGCEQYIEWDFMGINPDYKEQPYPCISCRLVGESYNIDNYPLSCPFISKLESWASSDKPTPQP